MKNTDIIKKTDGELTKALIEQEEALRVFRFGEAGGRSRNVKEGRTLKKTIARILSELSARGVAKTQENA